MTNCFTDRPVDSLLVRWLHSDLSTRKNARQTEETQQSRITGGRDKGNRGCVPFCDRRSLRGSFESTSTVYYTKNEEYGNVVNWFYRTVDDRL